LFEDGLLGDDGWDGSFWWMFVGLEVGGWLVVGGGVSSFFWGFGGFLLD
jgi:hypothetical protein